MKFISTGVLFAFVLALTGCSTWQKLNDTERGGVIGAGTGVIVGNAIAPGVGGALLGGAAGAAGGALIGREVDRNERRHRPDRY